MLRKEKNRLDPSQIAPSRPTRKSFPFMDGKTNQDSLQVDVDRRKKSAEKKKVSRVHLGRLQFLDEEVDEPEPGKPISLHDFFMAASSGKIKTVTKYLDDGGDVNATDWCDRTALHRASLYEQPAVVNLLIDRGAKVNVTDKLCNTPLHWACRGNNMEIVKLLLANKAKVNKKDQLQSTPLHVATRVGFLDCVTYLIECGAKINEKDCEGDTPIHDAIRLARPKVVRTLILHGANMSMKNMNGKTTADMMQAWYNSTKEAILSAEKERKRKGIDVEKLTKEMKEDGNIAGDSRVNVKRFSIDSFESWKDDLMNCAKEKPSSVTRSLSKSNLKACKSVDESQLHNQEMTTLQPVEEESESRPTIPILHEQLVSIEGQLSHEECKALTKMEKATPIIK